MNRLVKLYQTVAVTASVSMFVSNEVNWHRLRTNYPTETATVTDHFMISMKSLGMGVIWPFPVLILGKCCSETENRDEFIRLLTCYKYIEKYDLYEKIADQLLF
jgi:hypothetical protein